MPTTVEVFVESRRSRHAGTTDESAFAELYARTYAPLVAYCRRYCPPGYDAEDIAQEAFSRAWSSWDRYSPARPFWPWVATIARRLCVDYWRRDERSAARDTRVAVLEPETDARPDELTEAADEGRIAVGAFRRLRADHQRIVGLRDIEGWSYEDIARFEGVTVESVRGSLRRARVSLRKSYETLARGVPIAVLLRGVRKVRIRFARRLVELQGQVGSSGVATTRLGEWFVSLVALSVAAMTFGPTGATGAAAAPRSSEAADSSLGTTPAGAAPGPAAVLAAGTGGAGGGATPGHNAAVPAPQPAPGRGTVLPTPPVHIPGTPSNSPNDTYFYSLTPSPDYTNDHTIFATGQGKLPCANPCAVLFASHDAGGTWSRLDAVGLLAERVLLPPAYSAVRPGAERRIFATHGTGLQVSKDDGATFTHVAPGTGTAAISPDFAGADPRILLPNVPGTAYDDRTRTVVPWSLSPAPANTSPVFSFAFSPDKSADGTRALFVGATGARNGTAQAATVSRCAASACAPAAFLPSGITSPHLLAPAGARADAYVFAWNAGPLYRSGRAALSFAPVPLPSDVEAVDLSSAADGTLYLIGLSHEPGGSSTFALYRSTDAGDTWAEVPAIRAMHVLVASVLALPDGRLIAAIDTGAFRCSVDGGSTWAANC